MSVQSRPAWLAAAATGVTYLVALGLLTAVLFGVPYLLFSLG